MPVGQKKLAYLPDQRYNTQNPDPRKNASGPGPKQRIKERQKIFNTEQKAPDSAINRHKKFGSSVWEQETGHSSHPTRTTKGPLKSMISGDLLCIDGLYTTAKSFFTLPDDLPQIV